LKQINYRSSYNSKNKINTQQTDTSKVDLDKLEHEPGRVSPSAREIQIDHPMNHKSSLIKVEGPQDIFRVTKTNRIS
jgi:hypothetical protein